MAADDDLQTLNGDVASSLVLSVPHGGTRVPEWCRRELAVPIEELSSDWRTAELYDLADVIAAPLVRTRLSRFVADPNRAPVAPFHAAAVDRVEEALSRQGFSVARNRRFTGGYIVRSFGADSRIDAIQFELNRRCYLNREDVEAGHPTPPRHEPARWESAQTAIAAVLASLV